MQFTFSFEVHSFVIRAMGHMSMILSFGYLHPFDTKDSTMYAATLGDYNSDITFLIWNGPPVVRCFV